MKIIIKYFFLTFLGIGLLTSCKKYLDKKPIKSLAVPSSLNDLQALLDANNQINQQGNLGLLELAADNYYVQASDWQTYDPHPTSNYTWDKDAYASDWSLAYYNPIYYSNIVLDELSKIKFDQKDSSQYKTVKGSALFYRAFAFYQLSQLYCKPFSTSSDNDPGIVLRLTSAITAPSLRSTVTQTFQRIIGDLKTASDLLPTTSTFPTRPTKASAYGALARTYLSMRDYTNAGFYADATLQQNNSLLDYNNISSTSSAPFNINTVVNSETIFFDKASTAALLSQGVAIIDSNLYSSYATNDLRKAIFFRFRSGQWRFKGSYGADPGSVFTGLAVDEMYLIRAESYARQGNAQLAMNDLNALLRKRWKKVNGVSTYTDQTAIDGNDALSKILVERRKELIFRGLRWSDLRRFNLEGANISLTRNIGGTVYTLPPNDARWVMLIPPDEISLSGIAQNPR